MGNDKRETKADWIVIDGFEYNITEFKKRHPGGNVISFYNEMDASDAFHAFHLRSEKAKKMLASIPRKPVGPESPNDAKDPLIQEFRQLREDLVKEGAFKPMYFMQFVRTLELVLIYILAMVLGRAGYIILGGLVRGIFVGRNGLLMHETGHRAYWGNMKLDRFTNWLFFTVWQGGSTAFWNNQHNKHHAATQELGYDIDLNTLPVVAFNVKIAKKGNPNFLRFQWLTFIPLQLFLFFFWKFSHTRFMIRKRDYFEIFGIVLHEIIEIPILYSSIGLSGYLLMTAISWACGGVYLATTFALNHTHKPVVDQHTNRNWVIRSADHTTNLNSTYFNNWFTGYLNYQIEHHMFPQIPHPRLPYIQPRVKALLRKHNVEYDERAMGEAFVRTIENLYEVGNWQTQEKYQYLLKQE